MKIQGVLLPTGVARFTYSYFGGNIEIINPFEVSCIFRLKDAKEVLIYSLFLNGNHKIYTLPTDVIDYIKQSYTMEFENTSSGEVKLYSIAYR